MAMQKTLALLCSTALLLAAGSASAAVTGTVKYGGKASGDKIDMKSDPKCGTLSGSKTDNSVVVNGGMLADTFVYIKNAPDGKYKGSGKTVLDQVGCRYTPKVFGLVVKESFTIKNSDPTLHNIHAFAKRGEFNIGMPTQGQTLKKKFKKEQVLVPIKCDVHPWMQAYVGVLEHPFFGVSDNGGKFSIDGLKDGSYDVVAHHPTLGEKMGKVTVAGGNGTVNFSF